jgi:type I restriction enzyme S subunit
VQIKDAPIKIADGNYSAKYPRQDEFMEDGVPFVRVNNLQDQTLTKEDLKYISAEKHSELKKGHLKTDDVLITTRGKLGVIALVPSEFDDANINAQIVLLRADNKTLLPKFLMYFLLSSEFQSQVFSGGSGSALQQLPVRVLENTYIPLPSPKEQQEISEIFSSVDEKLVVNKKLKAKLILLKKGLMQDLLSGTVRTNI